MEGWVWRGIEESQLLLWEIPCSSEADTRLCVLGRGSQNSLSSWGVREQALLAAYPPSTACSQTVASPPPEIPHFIFHKAFNFYLRDWTPGLGLGWSVCQAGCRWVLSLGDSEKSAPFSPLLTCGSLKTKIEATSLCSSLTPHPRRPGQ